MNILQKIAQKFNQMDIDEMSIIEKEICELLSEEGLLVKEEIPYGIGQEDSYWVYSLKETTRNPK